MKKQYKTFILIQISIITFLLISFVFLKSNSIYIMPKCIFKEKFGILCPSCNGTTFAINLANGNFIKAFQVHPVFFITFVYLILLDAIYIINILLKKDIKFFKWWYVIIWLILLITYTIFRNITFYYHF